MKVLIGTKNPGKIEGAKQAFDKYFKDIEIIGVEVNSEVSNQPFNEEILEGARNRIKNLHQYAKENNLQADYYVASEAGITTWFDTWIDINLAVVENAKGLQCVGTSQGFLIPKKYQEEIKKTELRKSNG